MEIGEGLSRAERETVIRRSDDDKTWNVWTSSPIVARRLEKLAKSHGVTGKETQGGISYVFPINAISLRNRRILTEEQRERLRTLGKKNISAIHGNNTDS